MVRLPLPEQRLRREDEDRLVTGQRHQFSGHCQLDGFTQANLIREDKSRATGVV